MQLFPVAHGLEGVVNSPMAANPQNQVTKTIPKIKLLQ